MLFCCRQNTINDSYFVSKFLTLHIDGAFASGSLLKGSFLNPTEQANKINGTKTWFPLFPERLAIAFVFFKPILDCRSV